MPKRFTYQRLSFFVTPIEKIRRHSRRGLRLRQRQERQQRRLPPSLRTLPQPKKFPPLRKNEKTGHYEQTSTILPSYCYQKDHMATQMILRLMAPVLPRQYYHYPSPPRSPKETPGTPVPVTKHISKKVFLQLFAGTVCIFVLGVLFWRIGRCFRRFTRNKVLKKGKKVDTRYARTWYGWVPLQQHEAAKNVFRKCWRKICEWTSWKTTRADYHWVWWDPGQTAHEEYRQNRSFLRWIPKLFRSKEHTTADTIWNRGPPPERHKRTPEDRQRTTMADAFPYSQRYHAPHTYHGRTKGYRDRLKRSRHQFPSADSIDGRRSFEAFRNSFPGKLVNGPRIPVDQARPFWSLQPPSRTRRKSIPFTNATISENRLPQSVSLPCLLMVDLYPQRQRQPSSTSCKTSATSRTLRKMRYSRKYQVWSARMELQASNQLKHTYHGFQEPPGTPASELLRSYASENSAPFGSLDRSQREKIARHLSNENSQRISSLRQRQPPARAPLDALDERNGRTIAAQQGAQYLFPSIDTVVWRHWSSSFGDDPLQLPEKQIELGTKDAKGKSPKKKHCRLRPKGRPLPLHKLNNWEIRWMDNLDRKLEWHFDQLTPGRRPFHFPLLANHWLNRKTWMVIDPVSRVPVDKKRQLGDPRFNVPYPAPRWEAKPKYPIAPHKKAHTPRIDSWRLAVNCQRRTSGMRDVVRAVELFDDSVDEPPDGHIDPASWILRRPPQGFGMSSKQRDAYYEGGTGWHETLSDWQRVRHGYRVRKMVYEGRVNRTRAKEIAFGLTRFFQKAITKTFEKENVPD